MPFLTDLRARLTAPVVAAVEAARAAAERAIPRKAATTEAEPIATDTLKAAIPEDLPPPPLLQRALRHAPKAEQAPATVAAPVAATVPAPQPAAPDPLEEAYTHLARMNAALAAAGEPEVAAAGARFHAAVRTLLEELSQNPAAVSAHRHPLASWVPGLALATERYVTLQRRAPNPDRRNDLVSVLDQVARRVLAHAEAAKGGNGAFRAA